MFSKDCFTTFTSQQLDPFQFAFKSHGGVDDAILTLLHKAFIHLDKLGSFIRVLFTDFSSAFSTIQPHLLAEKLLRLNLDPTFTLWIVCFLLNRTQSVCFQSVLSSQLCTSTGAPQGTVLAHVLFTPYTNDCRGTGITPVIKYSDDSAIEDLPNSDDVYFSAVRRSYTWCGPNFVDLNASETKEMLMDFRKNPLLIPCLDFDDQIVERVDEYKHLVTVKDSSLFYNNIDAILRKCQPRLYCLHKLRNIGIDSKILHMYYKYCVLAHSFVHVLVWKCVCLK